MNLRVRRVTCESAILEDSQCGPRQTAERSESEDCKHSAARVIVRHLLGRDQSVAARMMVLAVLMGVLLSVNFLGVYRGLGTERGLGASSNEFAGGRLVIFTTSQFVS